MAGNYNKQHDGANYYAIIKGEILLEEREDENKYLDNLKSLIEALLGPRKDGISSSQLRNIYSKVKTLKKPKELYLLRPKLAYIHGRPNSKGGMKKLIDYLDEQIKKVKNESELKQFQNFFESVIAYHKYLGGKD
ncbi:MAG: type III-A CRISPR-associated protein Csm2 [Ignavibacteriae bacterium]|nr:type III-A CRISPR-associated protein Csm2 [Ignavibacteriota bacterium]NOH00229.1 type III-A CRISPR-associated protein Csm2 [Ignavibacteriota bacterium]